MNFNKNKVWLILLLSYSGSCLSNEQVPAVEHIGASVIEHVPTKFYTSDTPSEESPLLVGLFMVRKEAHVIVPTLKPYVEGGMKHFFIFETDGVGESEETIQLAKDYLTQSGVTFFVAREPYSNFQVVINNEPCFDDNGKPCFDYSKARNRGLELVREKFPKSTFILYPDAEWFIHNVAGLLEFCKQKIYDTKNMSYLVRIMNRYQDFPTPRLIRTQSEAKFYGEIHEVVLPPSLESVPGDVYFELGYTKEGAEASAKRQKNRDLKIQLYKYKMNPNDSRNVFYLARTYDSINDKENAYKYYLERSKLNHRGWDEENFWNQYSLAMTAEDLMATHPEFTWSYVLDLYLKAHTLLPMRIEPLVRIAEYYWKTGNIPLAFLFARRVVEPKYPADFRLFIDKNMYEFQRYELLSKTAAHVGECALGERATKILLEKYPRQYPQLYRNYALYLECDKTPSDLWGYNLNEADLRSGVEEDDEDVE